MKTRKLMLPMMAFICAIGMSFATVGLEADLMYDYIQTDSGWEEIPELNCGEGIADCRALVDGEGPFLVYDEENNLLSLKSGNGNVIIVP